MVIIIRCLCHLIKIPSLYLIALKNNPNGMTPNINNNIIKTKTTSVIQNYHVSSIIPSFIPCNYLNNRKKLGIDFKLKQINNLHKI